MKTNLILTTLIATACAATFTGCGKNETSKPVVESASNAVSSAVSSMKDTAGQVTDKAKEVVADAKDKAKAAVVEVKDSAAKATETVSAKFDETIASAKKFIADKNYSGALDELKKLSSLKLSDAQTKVVDGLKEQVQKLISAGTAGAVDAAKGLLGK